MIAIGQREERNGNERIWMVGMRGEYEVCVREEKRQKVVDKGCVECVSLCEACERMPRGRGCGAVGAIRPRLRRD